MTYQPRRIQRKRTKGWRAPLCGCGCGKPARYVGRGSRWGNPWQIKPVRDGSVTIYYVDRGDYLSNPDDPHATCGPEHSLDDHKFTAHLWAAVFYRDHHVPTLSGDDIAPLRGHDLMCWCPPDQPCHADVLLEIANTPKQHEQVK